MAVSPIKLLPRVGNKLKSGIVSFWGRGGTNEFYPGGADDQRRFGRAKLAKDIAEIMIDHRQRMMLGDSRYIYQAFSTVSGAVDQKANYVYGNAWRLQSLSKDKAFVEAVEKDFEQIDRLLDTRGNGFSFRKSAWIGSKTLDVDGDYFIILTENKETGFPKLQFLEAHRISSVNMNGETVIQDGTYAGRRIFNGVIVNDYMEPIAYRVADDSMKRGYQDVPANGVIHVNDFKWFSQCRGQPTVAAAILDWYDLAETRDAEKVSQKVNSALALIESNESGRMDMGNSVVNPMPGSDGRLQTQLMDSGLIRYIKNGGSLTAHSSARPSDQWLNFTHLVESSAFYAMGWRREMLDSSKVGGAGVRGFAADVNKSIATRCEVLHMAMQRAALYIIAKRAKQGVYTLPEDWYRVTFTKPAQFTVDEGRMRKADIEDLRAGLITEDAIVEARGMNYSDILHKLAANAKMRQDIAAEYGIDESQLGILTKPGDQQSAEQVSEEELEHKKQLLQFENLKAKFDSYGVGVRAGTITPQADDEDAFRSESGLPPVSDAVKKAWIDDGGFRRPITLQSGEQVSAEIEQVESEDDDDEKENQPNTNNENRNQ